jgi:hypothetical protein
MSKKKINSKERYNYLINARNFHYENFNKWMTYFYVAIGALFVGYYTISTHNDLIVEKITLLSLGYITSLFWYWSSKGYYFWNINFITLINDCEEKSLNLKAKDRVYFVFANTTKQNNYWSPISGANISTSKIAILFSFIVSIVWSVLLSLKLTELGFVNLSVFCAFLISIISTLLLSYLIPQFVLKSEIDFFPDLKINQRKRKNKTTAQTH